MAERITEFMTYKGHPLLRSDMVLCYGNPKERAVLTLNILTTENYKGYEIPELILVGMIDTKTGSLIKQTQQSGLFKALDIGASWLDRELKKQD
ncbi:hypothetical protein SDC9_125595 [bioreactor metagenome]|uniref:Uncharacterized protein n=1 Tax=bioreactor metagenome TaxID=1076179 RepID=A0A645CNX8_9ZZZZ|nr:hypothetical protein [Oscillospiraceae bacterium]